MSARRLLLAALLIAGVALVVLRRGENRLDPGPTSAAGGVDEPVEPTRDLTAPASVRRDPVGPPASRESAPAWVLSVVDPSGAPVEGAELRSPDSLQATTDAEGRLRCGSVLTGELLALDGRLTIEHPEYVTAVLDPSAVGSLQRLVLQRAWNLTVGVLDRDGTPISGAACRLLDASGTYLQEEITGAGGAAHLRAIRSNPVELTVSAEGFVPHQRRFVAGTSGEETLEVRLELGRSLEVQVADVAGRPVEGALVSARHVVLHGGEPGVGWSARTDRSGIAYLEGFPDGGNFQVETRSDGHATATKTFVATRESIELGLDFTLVSFARLVVTVRDTVGRPVEAVLRADIWQLDDSSRKDGLVIGRPPDATPAGGSAATYVLDRVPAGPAVTVYAQVGGALVGSVRGLHLAPGEERAVTVVVPEHLRVDLSIVGGSCRGGRVRLKALDGRQGESTAPPWAVASGRPLVYEATLDGRCRAELRLTPGLYRMTVRDSAERLIHTRDWSLEAGGEHEIRLTRAHDLSGRLLDDDGRPLSGWTVVARSPEGVSASARTALGGRFLIEGFGAERANLHALTPSTWLRVRMVSGLELPAPERDYRVSYCAVAARLVDFETGMRVVGTVQVDRPGFDAFRSYRRREGELVASDTEALGIEVSPGAVHLTGTDGARERAGSVELELRAGDSLGVEVYLTAVRVRRFEISGLGNEDVLRWTASRNGRTTRGRLAVLGDSELETNLPDGPVRFERVRGDRTLGAPVTVVVSSEPVRLSW